MSINGLNSNQILTLMQLESGKTYTFVGTTGNYSDYMCVTAGMFESPVAEIENYVLEVSFKIGESTQIRLNLPSSYDSGVSSFFAPGTIATTGSQGLWYNGLSEDYPIFSLNGNDNSFFYKDDVMSNSLRVQSEEINRYYIEGGQSSDYEHSYDCGLGYNSASMQPVEVSREYINIEYSENFVYNLCIKDDGSGLLYTDEINIVGDEDQRLFYFYEIQFPDFYGAPIVYNGLNSPTVNYDETRRIGNTLYRTVELTVEGEIGFVWKNR